MTLQNLLRNGLLLGLTLALAGCKSETPKTTSGTDISKPASDVTIKIDGSSTVFPVMEAVAEEFQNKTRTKVTVGISGTGGGFKKFTRGETDISNASRPILTEEIQTAKEHGIEFIELPICFDALTVVVHPKNALAEISIAELKAMWEPAAQGKITTWKQVNAAWPDQKLTLFGAGSDSGTFDYFTEAVVGKAKSSRGDYTASEDDNTLVQGVGGDEHALGYLPYAYYEPNKAKLKALRVIGTNSKAVEPSPENVLNGTYMPMSRPLFIYVNRKSADKPEVKSFVEFMLKNVGELATQVKYLPLPANAYSMATARFDQRQVGTVFGGVPEVGVTIEDILKREAK